MPGAAVIAALKWLGVALQALSVLRPQAAGRIVKVKAYVKDLRQLEEGSADTSAWSKLAAGGEVTLTAAEAAYLNSFKGLWDKYFKKPLAKLDELIGIAEDAEAGE